MVDRTDERYLLDGAWFPVTHGITFLAADAATCADVLVSWRGRATTELTGGVLRTRRVEGTLPELLGTLLPLRTAYVTRYLMLPTAGARWTAMLDNSWRGSEAISDAAGMAAQPGGMRGVGVVDSPQTFDRRTRTGWWGARGVAVFDPDPSATWGVRGSSVKVQVSDTGRRWELTEPDEEWPLPDPLDRTARRTQDTFSRASLLRVADSLGIRLHDEGFYAPDGWGVLVELVGGRGVPGRERTLAQAQANEFPEDD